MARRSTQVDSTRDVPGNPHAALGDEVLDFMRLLWALDHALQSTSKRMKRELGVTGPQRVVVRMVGQFPGISAGALAGLLKLHPSTLTGVLERLVSRGVLTRAADPKDARRALFKLTRLGKTYNTVQEGTVEAAVRKALRRVRPETLAASKEALGALIAELKPD